MPDPAPCPACGYPADRAPGQPCPECGDLAGGIEAGLTPDGRAAAACPCCGYALAEGSPEPCPECGATARARAGAREGRLMTAVCLGLAGWGLLGAFVGQLAAEGVRSVVGMLGDKQTVAPTDVARATGWFVAGPHIVAAAGLAVMMLVRPLRRVSLWVVLPLTAAWLVVLLFDRIPTSAGFTNNGPKIIILPPWREPVRAVVPWVGVLYLAGVQGVLARERLLPAGTRGLARSLLVLAAAALVVGGLLWLVPRPVSPARPAGAAGGGPTPEQLAFLGRQSLDQFLRAWAGMVFEVARAGQAVGVAVLLLLAGRAEGERRG